MPNFKKLNNPTEGQVITFQEGKPIVSDNPIVPFIRG